MKRSEKLMAKLSGVVPRRMWLCLLAVGLSGCSPNGKGGSQESVVVVPSEAGSVKAEGELSEGRGTDGGTQETAVLWGAKVKTQLGHLAEVLVGAETEFSFGGPIEMADAGLLQTKEIYDGESLRISEVVSPVAGVPVAADVFVDRVREVLSIDGDGSDGAVSFKLFGIVREGDRLKTRQRLEARGMQGERRVNSSAVVDATWLAADEGALPRLERFSMPRVVRSELSGGAAGGFDDLAGAVLGETACWDEQLRWGMNTWAGRIDHAVNPDFLGYHGVAVRDVDGDGFEDLYLCQPGGLPNLLLRQRADGTMEEVSAAAGVDWLDNSTGALLVDLDNDGDADLAVATQRAFLVMENDGAGKFSLRTELREVGHGYSPTAADYDLDGDLDLLVLRYSADSREIGDFPEPYPFDDARNGGENVLLENRGGFGFADVTEARGLGAENYRFSFSASWEDYDNDGDADLYVANDFGPNQMFRNDGGSFADVSVDSGAQDWGFGMSATWADYDRDGAMDLYISSMFSGAGNLVVPNANFGMTGRAETKGRYLKMIRGNSLLRNAGHGRFADVTEPMAEGFAGWAWGAKFADLNNDGWEDLYVANGYLTQPDPEDL